VAPGTGVLGQLPPAAADRADYAPDPGEREQPDEAQWDEDELAEQWTLAPDELALLANKGSRHQKMLLAKSAERARSRQEASGQGSIGVG
jgi:hypothetical protein